MIINSDALLILISGLVLSLMILAFRISARRLQISGSAYPRYAFQGYGYLCIWLTWVTAAGVSGWLSDFSKWPPPFLFFFLSIIISAFAFAYSSMGLGLAKGLSYSELVGFHSFRILVEITLVVAARDGIAPLAMTLHGWNFDIVMGLSAIVLMFYIPRFPNYRLLKAWNWIGLGFLFIVVSIGFFSFPAPWRLFMAEPSNIWITKWPSILLPGILVWSALVGHLLIFRKLALDPKLVFKG